MSRKTEQAGLKQQIAQLEKQVANTHALWMRAEQEKGQGLADATERGKLEKIVRIVNHITAGRGNEAIQELLQPLPFVFQVDIRFADDKTRIAAEAEQLEKCKQLIVSAVQSVKLANGKQEVSG